jgi:anaerobic magnesium-protoporphyrin IX monomethyl ester cyclase
VTSAKNALLVSTPWEQNQLVFTTTDDISHYPIGLAYLHSYLESKGHVVETMWLNNSQTGWESAFTSQIMNFKPDVIGFNMLTMNRVSTYLAIELVHEKFPGTMIVLGGIHATLMYAQLLKKYPFVIIIRGEGEATFTHLLEETSLTKIEGIAYSDNGIVIKNPDRELIQCLDDLPFPKHELFFKGNRTGASILTSRGCPNSCSFCCLNPISKRKVRYRSVKNVISEVEYLIRTFPNLETIWFHDDSFFLDNKRVIAFCDEIIKRGIRTSFICSGRAKPISEEMVMKLELAGFKSVMLGLESGDEYVLELSHKGIVREDVVRATRLFAKTKIQLSVFIIVGLPGESRQTILNAAEFLQKLQRIKYLFFYDIGVLTVYPGTEVYDLMKQAGQIDDDFWLTAAPTPYYTVDHQPEVIQEYKELLMSYISVEKIITPSGFIHQFSMIPWALPYVVRYKIIPKIMGWVR